MTGPGLVCRQRAAVRSIGFARHCGESLQHQHPKGLAQARIPQRVQTVTGRSKRLRATVERLLGERLSSKRSHSIARSCTRTSRSTIKVDFSARFYRSASGTIVGRTKRPASAF